MFEFLRRCGGRSPTRRALTVAIVVAAAHGTAWSGEILDRLAAVPNTKTFAELLGASHQEDAIDAKPFTLFVPVDSAFAKLPKDALASLSGPRHAVRLRHFVLYHAVRRKYGEADLAGKEMDIRTIAGGKLDVDADDGPIMIENATVVGKEIRLPNGIIHLVDGAMVPH